MAREVPTIARQMQQPISNPLQLIVYAQMMLLNHYLVIDYQIPFVWR
jgi:hypothetical protein